MNIDHQERRSCWRACLSILPLWIAWLVGKRVPLPKRLCGSAVRFRLWLMGLDALLPQVSFSVLGSLASADDGVRRVLFQVAGRPISLESLMAKSDPPLVDLRVVYISKWGDPVARSSACATIARSPYDAGAESLALAMGIASRCAETISLQDARDILVYCLPVVDQAIAPYDRPQLTYVAARAARALLLSHPSLDPMLVDRVTRAPTDGLRGLSATVVQSRRLHRQTLLQRILARWEPEEPMALVFCQDCDSRTSRADERSSPSSLRVPFRNYLRVWRDRVTLALILAVPIAARASMRWPQIAVVHNLVYGDVVGALAALIALHVVASQLAAGRLPGPLAGRSSTPSIVYVGYIAALLLLIFITLLPRQGDPAAWLAGALTTAGGLFIFSIVATALGLVSRTNAVAASFAFTLHSHGAMRRAGIRLGRLHRRALRFREIGELLPMPDI